MRWTWDYAKNEANLQTYGLGFEAAAFVFDNLLSATDEDPFSTAQRWRTIGMVGTQVVMVVHTWPQVDTETGVETRRIISARKATRRERDAYGEGNN